MDFEDYIKDVEKTIHFLCLKYNVFYLKDNLLGESFICFVYCKDRFKGRKEEFYFYFKKSLERHLTKRIFEELKMRNRYLEIEEEVFNNLEFKTSYKDIEEIMEEAGFSEIEKKICLLRCEGRSFLSISKEIGLSYYKVLSFRDSIRSKLSKVGIYNRKFETRYGGWKKWYNDNKEEYMEYQRNYRERNRARIITYQGKWREKNKEKIKKYMRNYMREYRKKNKDKIRKYNKKWIENNPNYHREYMKKKRRLCLKNM